MGAASRTGSVDRVYTLIEYNRTPATMVDTKPTMNAARTAYLSRLDVFLRDQSSGNGSAKINISDATVNEFVAIYLMSDLHSLERSSCFHQNVRLTVEKRIYIDASPW